MTINPKIRLSPCARIKNSLATCIKYQEAATTTSWEEDFCRTAQVRSQWVVKEMICKNQVCLFSKINAFLQSHEDHHKADAPKRIKGFKSDRIPSSQWPNISSTLWVQEVPKPHKLQPNLDVSVLKRQLLDVKEHYSTSLIFRQKDPSARIQQVDSHLVPLSPYLVSLEQCCKVVDIVLLVVYFLTVSGLVLGLKRYWLGILDY